MKGQEITPWSIYNQTIHRQEKKKHKKNRSSPSFPKIQNAKPQKPQPIVEIHSTRRRQSLGTIYKDLLERKEFKIPFATQFEHSQKPKKDQIEKKETQVQKSFEYYMIIQLIKEELKIEDSQLSFLRLLKQEPEQPKEQLKSPTLQVITKDKSFLLDRHVFPRVNMERSIMIVNLTHQEEKSTKDISQQSIGQILKKEIGSLISNRMKIMGKTKEITYKL